MSIWEILGIEPTNDKAAIRHAYAEKTRTCHPEENPEGFDTLHKAFLQAMQYARRNAGAVMPQGPAVPPPGEEQPVAQPSATVQPAYGPQARQQWLEDLHRVRCQRMEEEKLIVEEYFSQTHRHRRKSIQLGGGQQDAQAQQFDFDSLDQLELSANPPAWSEPEPEVDFRAPVTYEQMAWINQPAPVDFLPKSAAGSPSDCPPSQQTEIKTPTGRREKPRGNGQRTSVLRGMAQPQRQLLYVLLLAVLLFCAGRYGAGLAVGAVAAFLYTSRKSPAKKWGKSLALWGLLSLLLPVLSVLAAAVVTGLRSESHTAYTLMHQLLISLAIGPAGLVGVLVAHYGSWSRN